MINHFDTVAQNWDQNQIHIKRTQIIAEELRKIITAKENQSALEFGAGTGLLSITLRDLFSEITLMDSSSEMVRITKEKLTAGHINQLTPLLFDLEKDIFNDKTFDIIFNQMALHHVSDIDNIISRFFDLLNPGGQLAIADLYKEDGTFHEFEFNGHRGFNPEDLAKILERSGFKEISYRPCYEIIKTEGPNKGKVYPLFLLVGKKIKKTKMKKIAVPVTKSNQIDDHFGHCEFYSVYTISEKNEITDVQTIKSVQGCGCKSDIASVLAGQGVTIMLAGGIGGGAINVLGFAGIKVVRGCSGNAAEVVKLYIDGKINDSGETCSQHEKHQGEGHICQN